MNKSKCIQPVARLVLAFATGSGLVTASHTALADPAAYIGGSYGIARHNGGAFDDNTQILKAFAGGKFNNYIGIEVAVNDYGKASNNAYKSDLNGYTLAVAGYLPLSDVLNLIGKFGNLWWKDDYTIFRYNNNTSGSELFLGLGAQFDFNESLAVRFEMERYSVNFDRNETWFIVDDNFDIDVASLGAVFTF